MHAHGRNRPIRVNLEPLPLSSAYFPDFLHGLDKGLVYLNTENQESMHLGMNNICNFLKPFFSMGSARLKIFYRQKCHVLTMMPCAKLRANQALIFHILCSHKRRTTFLSFFFLFCGPRV